MRFITKGREPASLTEARGKLQSTPGVPCERYTALDSAVRHDILEGCLKEQKYLCAYTCKKIGRAHV